MNILRMRENYYEKAKKDFKKPIKKYYFGPQMYGNPYFFPWNYNEKIIRITKSKDKMVHRSDYKFKLLGYDISFGTPVIFTRPYLSWEQRNDVTIRVSYLPAFHLYFFGLQFCIFYGSFTYWEMLMFYLKICNSDIERAENEWSWIDGKTKESTWKKEFIKYG